MTKLKHSILLLLGLSIVMLAAYAGAQSAPTNVSGTWTGSTTRGATTLVLDLKQDGQKVTGTLSGAGTDDGPVTGTISGNIIRLKYDDGRETTPSLNVKGDQIEGLLSGTQIILRRTSK